jgi:hypothetical protein
VREKPRVGREVFEAVLERGQRVDTEFGQRPVSEVVVLTAVGAEDEGRHPLLAAREPLQGSDQRGPA